jgi:hypothetical protein
LVCITPGAVDNQPRQEANGFASESKLKPLLKKGIERQRSLLALSMQVESADFYIREALLY